MSDHDREKAPRHLDGMTVTILNILALIGATVVFIMGMSAIETGRNSVAWIAASIAAGLYLFLVGPVLFGGLKVIKPNEALVFTLLGRYHGCLKEAGFYFINPLAQAVRPVGQQAQPSQGADKAAQSARTSTGSIGTKAPNRALSLKAMTLSNDKQKVNDALGNPIVIGIAVVWKVVNPTKAVLDVDDYPEFLSIQCDAALRNIVRLYPYDSSDEEEEKSLRGSSQEVAKRLRDEIHAKVDVAGIEIIEARITHLSYAPEIAAAMLQRQQASAVIAARQKIVEGAVGMVEMALAKLSENNIVDLDEERKAAMVSNLLVVLCSNRDTQPVVNSGSIY
ncbi:MAG TPA: SPFH domain-containing protein [Spirochaetales bacterium]|nr:SPFH domain-containing protein [Spirochaetales bacterium]